MTRLLALASLVFSSTACKPVECGPGTIEQNGTCVPADHVVDPAACGPFTHLEGGVCLPDFAPTECDPASTTAQADPVTGVQTCIGTAIGFACEQPATGKMTICGQLFDLETGTAFSDGGDCTPCAAPLPATGVCSVGIRPVDAVKFATNPQDPGAALASGPVVLDTCGRFKVPDITLPAVNPFVGLGIDDADQAKAGPAGTTNSVGVATAKQPDVAVQNFEGFVAKKATTDAWQASGGPPITGGMFVAIFRANTMDRTNQAGVTILRNGNPIPADDNYFVSTQANRTTIDPAALATGANGTAIVTNAKLGEGYTAAPGPLPPECAWSISPGVSVPFVLFVQIFRPVDASGQNCTL